MNRVMSKETKLFNTDNNEMPRSLLHKILTIAPLKPQHSLWINFFILLSVLFALPARADVSINKSFSPSIINPGDTSKLTIKLFNSSAAVEQKQATFTDAPDPGIQIIPGTEVTDCGGTLAATSSSIKLTGGTIAPNGECTVTVNVTSTTAGNNFNTLPVGALQTVNGTTGTTEKNLTPASATLQVITLSPISGTKGFTPSLVPPSGISRARITLSNSNSIAVFGTSFTDNLPIGLKVSGTPNPTIVCSSGGNGGGTITVPADNNSFKVNNLTLPANGNCVIEIDVIAPPVNNKYRNTITKGAITTGRGITNDQAFYDDIEVDGRVRIAKAFSKITANIDQVVILTITVINGTAISLNNAGLIDNLPTGLQIAPTPRKSTDCTGGTVGGNAGDTSITLGGGTIPAATPTGFGICTIKVDVVGKTTGSYTNTIGANTLTNTENITNSNAASDTITITSSTGGGGTGKDSLTTNKSFSPPTIPAGGISTLTITLSNPTSNVNLTALEIKDTLPAGMTVASGKRIFHTCTLTGSSSSDNPVNSNQVSIFNTALPAGRTCTITADVTVPSEGIYKNTIPAKQVVTKEKVTNDSAASASLIATAGVRIQKSFVSPMIAVGGISRMRIDIENPQTYPITQAAFLDNFVQAKPTDNFTIANPVNLTNSCGGTINGNSGAIKTGDTSLSLVGGIIPPAFDSATPGKCSILIDVTKLNAPPATNTIAANAFTSKEGATNPLVATAKLTGVAKIGITVNKEIKPVSVAGGSSATMTIDLANQDLSASLNDVKFTDTMPTGMTIATQPDLTNTCGGTLTAVPGTSSLSLAGGAIAPSGTCKITLSITSTTAGNLTNVISANAVTSREGAKNPQEAKASITFLPRPGVSKAFSPSAATVGDVVKLTITISNFNNSSSLNSVGITDTLPTGLVIASPNGAATTCTNGSVTTSADSVTLAGATMPPQASCTVSVNVKAITAGARTNTIAAKALLTSSGDTNLDPASASFTATPSSNPHLILVKRITAIGKTTSGTFTGTSVNGFNDLTTGANAGDDNDPGWSSTAYLRGAFDTSQIPSADQPQPQDEMEYTIYFLSNGAGDAKNVSICDFVPQNTAYVANSLQRSIGTGMPTPISDAVGGSDTDGGFYSGSSFPTTCTGTSPGNGAVVVNVGQVDRSIGAGNPATSYGFIRFRAKIN